MTTSKHNETTGDPNLGPDHAKDLESLDAHITQHWGASPEVLHEIYSEYVHIDLYVVPATPTRPFHSVITAGMSHKPMTVPPGYEHCRYCELVIALPMDWPIDKEHFADEKNWWPFRQLKQAARFPHASGSGLWYGHTIANEDPPESFAQGIQFCAGIISIPSLCPREAWMLIVRPDKEVYFFSFLPIYRSELDHAREHGSDALFERLDELDVTELIQRNRPKAV